MVNTEASTSREYTLETLRKPDFLADDCSSISLLHLHADNIVVGHEQGCYLTAIEANPGTTTQLTQLNNNEVVSLCSRPDDRHVFFAAAQKSVYVYDERISLTSHQHSFTENVDEVNEVLVNTNGHLAACDDAGEIKIYDLQTNSVFRSLRRKHTNICSSLTFLPGPRADELVTGGLDSQLIAWDYRRVKVLQTVSSQELLSELGDDSVYMFNPPLVYSVDVSDDGQTLAAGLANGTLQLFKVVKGKKVLAPCGVVNKHSSVGVSAVCFVKPEERDSGSTCLVTGGNDGVVNLWTLPGAGGGAGGRGRGKSSPVTNKVYDEEEIGSLLTASMDTHSKVNFIGNVSITNQRFAFVCDQTSSLKYLKI